MRLSRPFSKYSVIFSEINELPQQLIYAQDEALAHVQGKECEEERLSDVFRLQAHALHVHGGIAEAAESSRHWC